MLNSSKENELIVDPCFGSGTTFLEAQENNRIWYGVELDAVNVKRIINRFKPAYSNEHISEEIGRC